MSICNFHLRPLGPHCGVTKAKFICLPCEKSYSYLSNIPQNMAFGHISILDGGPPQVGNFVQLIHKLLSM